MSAIIIGSIVAVVVATPVCWILGGYNTLIKGRQNIDTMFSNIKTEYQRRADLFYNLAEAVKSYAKFEKETLTAVVAARSGKFGSNPKEAMGKMKQLDGFMGKLMLLVEKYPDLRAVEEYKILMQETRITEDRINLARTEYNDTVREYNLFVMSFPSKIIAGMFNHFKEDYFKNEDNTNKCPKMNLKI